MGIIEDPPIALLEHVRPLHFNVPIADINPQVAGLDEEIEKKHFGLIRDRFYSKVASGHFGSQEQLRQIVEEAETSPHLALGLPPFFVSALAFQQSMCTDPTLSRNQNAFPSADHSCGRCWKKNI
jgi:hypothetical protein